MSSYRSMIINEGFNNFPDIRLIWGSYKATKRKGTLFSLLSPNNFIWYIFGNSYFVLIFVILWNVENTCLKIIKKITSNDPASYPLKLLKFNDRARLCLFLWSTTGNSNCVIGTRPFSTVKTYSKHPILCVGKS